MVVEPKAMYALHHLDEDLWQALHAKAILGRASISQLIRTSARKDHMGDLDARRAAMLGIVGLWKDRTDLPDTETYVRNLRNDNRMKRLKLK